MADKLERFFCKVEKELKMLYPHTKTFVPRPDPKNGRKDIDIMFVNERPGRIGTKLSGFVSFDNNDPSAKHFKECFDLLNLQRSKIYITNSCLWIPDIEGYVDTPPTKKELQQGAKWFSEQLEIVNPKVIVALGNSALRAMRIFFADSNQLKKYILNKNIGEVIKDTKYWIYPIYHTSLRVRNSRLRTAEQQKKDWIKVREILDEISVKKVG